MTVQRIEQAPAALARSESASPAREIRSEARPALTVVPNAGWQRMTSPTTPAVAGLTTPVAGGATSADGRRVAVARLNALLHIAKSTLEDPAVDAEARRVLAPVFDAELAEAEAQVASFAV